MSGLEMVIVPIAALAAAVPFASLALLVLVYRKVTRLEALLDGQRKA